MRWMMVSAGVLCIILGGAFVLTQKKASACESLSLYPSKFSCYMSEVGRAVKSGGLEGGFSYAASVRPLLDYQLNHIIMHEIGHLAYQSLGFSGALTDLQQRAGDNFDFELDGYRHGLFEEFFAAEGARSPVELARAACPDTFSLDLPDLPPGSIRYEKSDLASLEYQAELCFHAVGHGVMYANDREIGPALSDCDSMPKKWQREWCYYGAFMVYTYNYRADYDVTPRRPLEAKDMQTLCRSRPERQRDACARLLGRGYLEAQFAAGKRSIPEEALATCIDAEQPYREACLVETAAFVLPIPFVSDPERMFSYCLRLDAAYQKACIFGAASGVHQGAGGIEHRDDAICAFIPKEFRTLCENARDRNYTVF